MLTDWDVLLGTIHSDFSFQKDRLKGKRVNIKIQYQKEIPDYSAEENYIFRIVNRRRKETLNLCVGIEVTVSQVVSTD